MNNEDMPDGLANMIKMLQNLNNSNTSNSSSTSTSNDNTETQYSPSFDMDMLFKMKAIMDQMNKKDDPRSNLLLSLKPYLKESRKSKVEQYVQLLNMSKIIDLFNNQSGGAAK